MEPEAAPEARPQIPLLLVRFSETEGSIVTNKFKRIADLIESNPEWFQDDSVNDSDIIEACRIAADAGAIGNDTNRMARLADDIERGVLSITELSGDDDGYGKLVPVETSRRMRQQETDLIVAALRANRALPIAQRIKDRIDTHLNNCLCEMNEGYDDSIVGFNEAWDIVRKVLKEEIERADTDQPTLPMAPRFVAETEEEAAEASDPEGRNTGGKSYR
jgi:hypothetical protein